MVLCCLHPVFPRAGLRRRAQGEGRARACTFVLAWDDPLLFPKSWASCLMAANSSFVFLVEIGRFRLG